MTTASKINLKNSFETALLRGDSTEEPLDIVREFKDAGGSQREAYDCLQEIWEQHGFHENESVTEDRFRDDLEYVMELVWGFCPPGRGVWESTLTNEIAKRSIWQQPRNCASASIG